MKKINKFLVFLLMLSCLISCGENKEEKSREIKYNNEVSQSDVIASVENFSTILRTNRNDIFITDFELIMKSEIITTSKVILKNKTVESKETIIGDVNLSYDGDNKVLKSLSEMKTELESKTDNQLSIINEDLIIQKGDLKTYVIDQITGMYKESDNLNETLNDLVILNYSTVLDAMKSAPRSNNKFYIDEGVPTIVTEITLGDEEKPTQKTHSILQINIKEDKMILSTLTNVTSYDYNEEDIKETNISTYSYWEYIEKEVDLKKLSLENYIYER